MRHITVTINVPPLDINSEEEHEGADPDVEKEAQRMEPDLIKIEKKPVNPITIGRRPKKAKRMKIEPPALDVISEDSNATASTPKSETELEECPLSDTKNLEESYNSLLNEISQSHEAMLVQKRQAVALLKQTNYGIQTHRQKQQMTLASYAKQKARKLPPISDSKTMYRYSLQQKPNTIPLLHQLSVE